MSEKKILVVDDDPIILMSLEFLMKKNGYTVMVARNGTEAMELLKAHQPDLVILDIMMPDVDGYAIGKFIKSDPVLQHIHIVYLSAKTSEANKARGIEIGASRYIFKPFSTRHLVKEINDLLQ